MKNEMPNLPEPNDPLDAFLREADGYIPDNGFTARVVKNLPARRGRQWRRFIVLSVSLLLGAALAVWQYPAIAAICTGAWQWSSQPDWPTVLGFVVVLAALAPLLWAAFTLANDEK